MNLRPGTFVSFVAHDLRLGARGFAGMFGALPARRVAAILVAALVGLHLVAWPAALWLGGHESGADGDRFLTAAMRSGVFFVLPWVVASAMTAVTRMLYQRGDLDLLFASPISRATRSPRGCSRRRSRQSPPSACCYCRSPTPARCRAARTGSRSIRPCSRAACSARGWG